MEVYLISKLRDEYQSNNNESNLLLLKLITEVNKNNLFKFFSDFVHPKYDDSYFIAKQNETVYFKSIYSKILESLYFINVLYEYLSNFYKLDPNINNVNIIKFLHDELFKSLQKCAVDLKKEN
ncbi:hypothetical protein II941_04230 [bacterium]|nr:hypothetical protein [bacterium]